MYLRCASRWRRRGLKYLTNRWYSSTHRSEFEEGCLSIPEIHEIVVRPETVRLRYLNRHFEEQEDEFSGMLARVVQHEYDHVDGVLFIDHLSPLRRRLLKRRLEEIRQGDIETDYDVLAAEQ